MAIMKSPARPARKAEVAAVLRAIRDLNTSMQQHSDATSRHLGMTLTEVRTLNLVSRRGAVTPTELGAHLRVTSGGVTGIIDRLESSGHLRRTEDPHDRRKVRVEVTESAREVARRSLGDLNDSLAEMLSGRSDQELELLRQLLVDIEARISAHTRSLDSAPPVNSELE